MWDLCAKFGDKALRCWLELLSIADRNEGDVPGEINAISTQVAWAIRSKTTKVQQVINTMTTLGWLTNNGSLKVANYAKYHILREDKKHLLESLPSEPSEPTHPNHKEELHKNVPSRLWPDEDLWLLALVKKQGFVANGLLEDYGWWEDVAKTVGGIEPDFIQPEFARMDAWLIENPQRRPTVKGMRRFVRGWLERAKEKRRFNVVKK